MVAVRDRIDELASRAVVVLVTFTDADSLEAYDARHDLGFTTLRDPDRAGYRAFGLGRGRRHRVWGWRSLRRTVALVRKGGVGPLRRPVEDTLQLGGDFVVDARGRLAWGFWGDGPDDRPSVDALVAAVVRADRAPLG